MRMYVPLLANMQRHHLVDSRKDITVKVVVLVDQHSQQIRGRHVGTVRNQELGRKLIH